MMLRVVTFNTLFGGHADAGLGAAERWDDQMAFLRTLAPDVLALQECNFWDMFGRRRLHRAISDLGMATGFLAEANTTTAGHKFHSAILLSDRLQVIAEDSDRSRYHHVLGWAEVRLPEVDRALKIRHFHLDPFDPRNRARDRAARSARCSGAAVAATRRRQLDRRQYPEPDWDHLDPHLLNGHLQLPSQGAVPESDRDACELLARAGFHDAAVRGGSPEAPTAAFGVGDVPRRQDLILASPALAVAQVNYQVRLEPVTNALSDHAAVCVDFDLRALQS